ncbi:tyrosine-type recombinase/integrase [Rhodococcus sp. 3Y1]
MEVLRHTGVRIEEMLEISHHSITQYRLPATGELIPLLQIAPSKTDEERLLVVSPDLADMLSTIVSRIRGADGGVPLVPLYDRNERIWAPAPLLFQWKCGGHHRAVSAGLIRNALTELIDAAGVKDAAGEPLYFQPHDLRRIFATDAIMNGMPPHIAQVLLGHKDINTTMGYKAIYPEEAINGHRAFISRRRALRPSEGTAPRQIPNGMSFSDTSSAANSPSANAAAPTAPAASMNTVASGALYCVLIPHSVSGSSRYATTLLPELPRRTAKAGSVKQKVSA